MGAGGNRGYDGVPEWEPVGSEHRGKLARAINRINAGKINCILDVTLRASQSTTTIVDSRIAPTSFICWMPQTANASAAERAGLYVSARTKGSAVLNHAANAATDQVFTLVILS